MTITFNQKRQTKRRQQLRNNPPQPEKILWQQIRNRQVCDVKFRRQHGIGLYIIDFFAPQIKLAIELDGNSHFYEGAAKYDENRTKFLSNLEINIIRFTNLEIASNLSGVMDTLVNTINKLLTTPSNSPSGRGRIRQRTQFSTKQQLSNSPPPPGGGARGGDNNFKTNPTHS